MADEQVRVEFGFGRTSETKNIALGAAVVVSLTIFFFSFFWNRFVGLRSGTGEFSSGVGLLENFFPYRDYFNVATPLNAIKAWAILSLFGERLIALRAFDVLERAGLGLLVYFWLVRLFRAREAAIAAIVTIVVSACDYSDPINSYNHDSVLLGVASGLVGTRILGKRLSSWTFSAAAVVSGFLAALSFNTKQTVGIGVTAAVFLAVALCVLRFDGVRRAVFFTVAFAAGWCLGAGMLLLWLAGMHILPEFFRDVFVAGPAAKASSPITFLTRTVRITASAWWAFLPAVAAIGLTIRAAMKASVSGADSKPVHEIRMWGLILITGAAALTVGALAGYAGVPRLPVSKPAIFYALYLNASLLAYYLLSYITKTMTRRQAECCLLAAISVACAGMLSLSWPVFAAMTVPSLAFPIAALLDGFSGWKKLSVYAACVILVAGATLLKIRDPFDFNEFYDPPVSSAKFKSSLPALEGMRLPESTVKLLDGTAQIVAEHSTPSDRIFTYPEFGIFYSVTHRRFPTLSGSHNIDVVNDRVSLEEANRILASPPAVLIYWPLTEDHLKGDESLWRDGRRSGQRDLIAAIETLLPRYNLSAVYDVPPNRIPIKIYTRK